jgi:hypothetical protein
LPKKVARRKEGKNRGERGLKSSD